MIPTECKYLSDAEFVKKNHGVTLSMVQKGWSKIPGAKAINGEIMIWPGSRYPFNMRGHKLDTAADRIYVLLKAISQFRYISHKELYLYESQFNDILQELFQKGYIELNHLGSNDGANQNDDKADQANHGASILLILVPDHLDLRLALALSGSLFQFFRFFTHGFRLTFQNTAP